MCDSNCDSAFLRFCQEVSGSSDDLETEQVYEYFFHSQTVSNVQKSICKRIRFLDDHDKTDMLTHTAQRFIPYLKGKEIESPIGLLARTMYRCGLNLKQKELRRRNREMPIDDAIESIERHSDSDPTLYSVEVDDRFLTISADDFSEAFEKLGDLNEDYRKILVLKMAGETVASIAEILKLSVAVAERRFAHARRHLKRIMVRDFGVS